MQVHFLEGKIWNGIGKEYNNVEGIKDLLFEGEYKEGKRWNGKGKEQKMNIDNILYFINALYKDGIIGGQVEEYDKYGRLQYKGEYLNNNRNRQGKEYDEYGKIKFEGRYLNNKKNGN